MNSNATKKKLGLKKTTMRELSVAEWEQVGGGEQPESWDCSNTCLTVITCWCTYNCITNTCTYTCP